MTENLQNSDATQTKSPFSPLQTGCAFVMLTNMIIYLGVVLFTFNLLDPSKIDASYLAKRGFTALPEPKSQQDTAFQTLSTKKSEEQQQIQTELFDSSKLGLKQEPSPAIKLSEIQPRKLSSSSPNEEPKPKAALTESATRSGKTTIRSASSRLYSPSIYPQVAVPQSYSPVRIQSPKTLVLETYNTLPVEMASGINFPIFSPSVLNPSDPDLYRPPNPIPEASQGGLKISSPPVGAESLYTNGVRKVSEPPPAKDQP